MNICLVKCLFSFSSRKVRTLEITDKSIALLIFKKILSCMADEKKMAFYHCCQIKVRYANVDTEVLVAEIAECQKHVY